MQSTVLRAISVAAPSVDFFAVHRIDRLAAQLVVREKHKAETAWAAGHLVDHDHGVHGIELAEGCTEAVGKWNAEHHVGRTHQQRRSAGHVSTTRQVIKPAEQVGLEHRQLRQDLDNHTAQHSPKQCTLATVTAEDLAVKQVRTL